MLPSLFSVPLAALQHYLYCPRQCALIHLECVWADNQFTAEGNVFHERMDQRNLSVCGIPGRSAVSRAVDPEKITEACTDIFGDRHGSFVPVHHDQYAILT